MSDIRYEIKKEFGVESSWKTGKMPSQLRREDVDALKNAGRGFRRKLKDLKKNRESKYMTVLLLYIAANTDINKDKLAAVATTLYREQLAGLFIGSII